MKDAMKCKLNQNGNTSSCLDITAEKVNEYKQIINSSTFTWFRFQDIQLSLLYWFCCLKKDSLKTYNIIFAYRVTTIVICFSFLPQFDIELRFAITYAFP